VALKKEVRTAFFEKKAAKKLLLIGGNGSSRAKIRS
jgi:hypothetical protein